MTREEAIDFGKMWLELHEDSKDSNTYEFFVMAIKAIDMWDKLFKSYETLVDEITEGGDTKNATKRIDDWCAEQLRSIISDHYAEMIMEDTKE